MQPDCMTSFSARQDDSGLSPDLVYFAFDLLHLDGEIDGLMRRSLLDRKARLEAFLKDARQPTSASASMSSETAPGCSRRPPSSASRAAYQSRSISPPCQAIG